ncbi:MAG: STAS domain-containing protein [Pseudomonadota bacterium]
MSNTIQLADSLDMTAAGPLVQSLKDQRGKPLSLNASQVRRLGGQCLQVLLSAQATWSADGQTFEIIEATPEFTDALALMGATQLAVHSTVQDLNS